MFHNTTSHLQDQDQGLVFGLTDLLHVHNGLTGSLLAWSTYFLFNRSQCVKLGSNFSQISVLSSGPQDPTFLLLVNDVGDNDIFDI